MINIEPQVIHDKILQVGQEWAEAKTQADIAEDAYKEELNEEIQKIRNVPGEKVSMAEAESRARITDHVKAACLRKNTLRGEEAKLKVSYNAAQIWFEAMRTKAATLRQEMHMSGSQR